MAAPKLSNHPAAFKHFQRRGVSSVWFLAAGDDRATVGIFVLFLVLGLMGWVAASWLG
jgi:hypothetical protein